MSRPRTALALAWGGQRARGAALGPDAAGGARAGQRRHRRIEVIHNALGGVAIKHPDGEVLPVPVLQQRVAGVHALERQCRFQDVGRALPGLIADLHTTLAVGRDLATLLPLGVLLHVRITWPWLKGAAAPTDLQH